MQLILVKSGHNNDQVLLMRPIYNEKMYFGTETLVVIILSVVFIMELRCMYYFLYIFISGTRLWGYPSDGREDAGQRPTRENI